MTTQEQYVKEMMTAIFGPAYQEKLENDLLLPEQPIFNLREVKLNA